MNGPRGWPGDGAEACSGERLALEVVTRTGRAAAVEVRLRAGSVEIWHHRALVTVFNRAAFRRWLSAPQAPLAAGCVSFSLDRMVDVHGRIAISLPDVLAWTLSPSELHTLQRRI